MEMSARLQEEFRNGLVLSIHGSEIIYKKRKPV